MFNYLDLVCGYPCLRHAREALSLCYEKRMLEPMMEHDMILQVDSFDDELRLPMYGHIKSCLFSLEGCKYRESSYIRLKQTEHTNAIDDLDVFCWMVLASFSPTQLSKPVYLATSSKASSYSSASGKEKTLEWKQLLASPLDNSDS